MMTIRNYLEMAEGIQPPQASKEALSSSKPVPLEWGGGVDCLHFCKRPYYSRFPEYIKNLKVDYIFPCISLKYHKLA